MTQQKSLKRRVRARMAKTGERYAAARRQILSRPAAEPGAEPSPEPAAQPAVEAALPANAISDDIILAKTGRRRAEWFTILDAWGARDRSHTEIAAWLGSEQGVPSWWRQGITVDYERAIGRRQVGQMRDGYTVSATKTIGVPVAVLFDAVVHEDRRASWLPDVTLRQRTATPFRTARFDVADDAGRVVLGFDEVREDRSRIALAHERLPDGEVAERWKTFWRERLAELARRLEG